MIYIHIVFKDVALFFAQCGQTVTVLVSDLDAGVAISNTITAMPLP